MARTKGIALVFAIVAVMLVIGLTAVVVVGDADESDTGNQAPGKRTEGTPTVVVGSPTPGE
jgi:hypothetical protein